MQVSRRAKVSQGPLSNARCAVLDTRLLSLSRTGLLSRAGSGAGGRGLLFSGRSEEVNWLFWLPLAHQADNLESLGESLLTATKKQS